MSVLRKIVSLGYWLIDSEKSFADFRTKPVGKEKSVFVCTPSEKLLSPLVIAAHVYYPDFAHQFIDALKQLPRETKVFATTPSREIKQVLESYLEAGGNPHDVRLTPNIGRNFAPLFVEFSKQLLKEDHFIHVHSKKSLHNPAVGREWLKRNTDLLLAVNGIRLINSITELNPKLGLLFVDVSDLIKGINFRWGRSSRTVRRHFSSLPNFERIKLSGKLFFPAGGMFWVKTEAIRPLLEMEWSYDLFPPEQNQIDGTIVHTVERLIGQLSLSRGFESTAVGPGGVLMKISSKRP